MNIIIVAILSLLTFVTPAAAQECVNVETAAKLMAQRGAVNGKLVSGRAAADIAKKLGAPYVPSHLMIYAKDGSVIILAFRDGCFVEAVAGPREAFDKLAPGVL